MKNTWSSPRKKWCLAVKQSKKKNVILLVLYSRYHWALWLWRSRTTSTLWPSVQHKSVLFIYSVIHDVMNYWFPFGQKELWRCLKLHLWAQCVTFKGINWFRVGHNIHMYVLNRDVYYQEAAMSQCHQLISDTLFLDLHNWWGKLKREKKNLNREKE